MSTPRTKTVCREVSNDCRADLAGYCRRRSADGSRGGRREAGTPDHQPCVHLDESVRPSLVTRTVRSFRASSSVST